jgi:hypothetical protein
VPKIDFTDAALNGLLDLLEDQFTPWPMQGIRKTDAPATDRLQSSGVPVPMREHEADEIDDLGIEDAVIRELARALQPQQG